jgi:hypothetical protein
MKNITVNRKMLRRLKVISVVIAITSVIILVLICFDNRGLPKLEYNKPTNGYVPNQQTAIEIAKSVLVPIYGKNILKYSPFKVSENDSTWIVFGTGPKRLLHDIAGASPEVEIQKKDGKILRVCIAK